MKCIFQEYHPLYILYLGCNGTLGIYISSLDFNNKTNWLAPCVFEDILTSLNFWGVLQGPKFCCALLVDGGTYGNCSITLFMVNLDPIKFFIFIHEVFYNDIAIKGDNLHGLFKMS